MNLPMEVTTFAITLGTIGVALGCLVLVGLMLAVVSMVLPNDPPIDALYGDSLMTRMKALKHEHDAKYVVGGKPRY